MSGRTPVPGSALHRHAHYATIAHARLPLSGLPSGQTLVQRLPQTPLSEQPAPAVFISSGGERAGAIAGALVGSPKCSSICRTVAGSVMNPTRRTRPPHPLHLSPPPHGCAPATVRVSATGAVSVGELRRRVSCLGCIGMVMPGIHVALGDHEDGHAQKHRPVAPHR